MIAHVSYLICQNRTEALLAARAAKKGIPATRAPLLSAKEIAGGGRRSSNGSRPPTLPGVSSEALAAYAAAEAEQAEEELDDALADEAGVEDGFAGNTPGKPLVLRGASFNAHANGPLGSGDGLSQSGGSSLARPASPFDEEEEDSDNIDDENAAHTRSPLTLPRAAPAIATTKLKPSVTVKLTVTAECESFAACFEPFAAKTDAGAGLRQEGFRIADPNGNGLCSLAEIEGFILQTLLSTYPRDKANRKLEKGRDLFDAFRPCYIKAFNDAKDYKTDSGAVLPGTKKATQDDFVSVGEFRLLCAYLCIYARMYDAFSLVDGGGSGRKGDDRKIDAAEWAAGWKDTVGHGFVGLQVLDHTQLNRIIKTKKWVAAGTAEVVNAPR